MRARRTRSSSELTAEQQAWLHEHHYEAVEQPGRSVEYRRGGRGPRAWPEGIKGKGIIAQMRRYLETRDSMRIERALYEFLTSRCNFSACFDLGPGDGWFREEHREPMTLIEEFAANRRDVWDHGPEVTLRDIELGWRGGRDVFLYADGLTCNDIAVALARLMHEHLDRLRDARAQDEHDRDIRELIALARRRKMLVVPPGFLVTEQTLAPPPSREQDPSLNGELRRLAYELGHDLAEPRAQMTLAG